MKTTKIKFKISTREGQIETNGYLFDLSGYQENGMRFVIHRPYYRWPHNDKAYWGDKDWHVSEYSTGCAIPVGNPKTRQEAINATLRSLGNFGTDYIIENFHREIELGMLTIIN